MNICLISREYPPETGGGGIGTHLHSLAHGLVARNNQVIVLSSTLSKQPSYSNEDGVHVYRIPYPRNFGFLNLVVYAYRVRREILLLKSRHDIQIIEAPEYGAESVILELLRSPVPIVVRLHTGTYIAHRMRNKLPKHPAVILSIILEWLAIQLADAVTAPTKSMANYCGKTLKLFGTNIDVIPNAVAIDAGLPKNHFCKPDKQILYVGRLERLKSPDFLSRVMAEILREYPNVSLVFIGLDSLQGPQKTSMQVYCKSLISSDLHQRVEFLGKQPYDVVENYLNQSDIFILPSRFESFGIAYVEAMAHGLPVIACKGSGVEDVVPEGIAGLFVEHDNDDALRDAILLLLSDHQLRREMGEAGRRFALSHYDAPVVAEAHENCYQSVVCRVTASHHQKTHL